MVIGGPNHPGDLFTRYDGHVDIADDDVESCIVSIALRGSTTPLTNTAHGRCQGLRSVLDTDATTAHPCQKSFENLND